MADKQIINVAIDSTLVERVRKAAREQRRPLNAQVELLIEAGLRSQGIEPANVSTPAAPSAPRR